MKKFLVILLTITTMFTFAACKQQPEESPEYNVTGKTFQYVEDELKNNIVISFAEDNQCKKTVIENDEVKDIAYGTYKQKDKTIKTSWTHEDKSKTKETYTTDGNSLQSGEETDIIYMYTPEF